MPPWNQMTPQQQMFLLQMMHGGGLQQPMAAPGQVQPGLNPSTQALTNQLANPMAQQNILQNPQMLQYLMQMRGAQAPPMSQFQGVPWALPQQVPQSTPWAQ